MVSDLQIDKVLVYVVFMGYETRGTNPGAPPSNKLIRHIDIYICFCFDVNLYLNWKSVHPYHIIGGMGAKCDITERNGRTHTQIYVIFMGYMEFMI